MYQVGDAQPANGATTEQVVGDFLTLKKYFPHHMKCQAFVTAITIASLYQHSPGYAMLAVMSALLCGSRPMYGQLYSIDVFVCLATALVSAHTAAIGEDVGETISDVYILLLAIVYLLNGDKLRVLLLGAWLPAYYAGEAKFYYYMASLVLLAIPLTPTFANTFGVAIVEFVAALAAWCLRRLQAATEAFNADINKPLATNDLVLSAPVTIANLTPVIFTEEAVGKAPVSTPVDTAIKRPVPATPVKAEEKASYKPSLDIGFSARDFEAFSAVKPKGSKTAKIRSQLGLRVPKETVVATTTTANTATDVIPPPTTVRSQVTEARSKASTMPYEIRGYSQRKQEPGPAEGESEMILESSPVQTPRHSVLAAAAEITTSPAPQAVTPIIGVTEGVEPIIGSAPVSMAGSGILTSSIATSNLSEESDSDALAPTLEAQQESGPVEVQPEMILESSPVQTPRHSVLAAAAEIIPISPAPQTVTPIIGVTAGVEPIIGSAPVFMTGLRRRTSSVAPSMLSEESKTDAIAPTLEAQQVSAPAEGKPEMISESSPVQTPRHSVLAAAAEITTSLPPLTVAPIIGAAPGVVPIIGTAPGSMAGSRMRSYSVATSLLSEESGRDEIVPTLEALENAEPSIGSAALDDFLASRLRSALDLNAAEVEVPDIMDLDPAEVVSDVVDAHMDLHITPVVPGPEVLMTSVFSPEPDLTVVQESAPDDMDLDMNSGPSNASLSSLFGSSPNAAASTRDIEMVSGELPSPAVEPTMGKTDEEMLDAEFEKACLEMDRPKSGDALEEDADEIWDQIQAEIAEVAARSAGATAPTLEHLNAADEREGPKWQDPDAMTDPVLRPPTPTPSAVGAEDKGIFTFGSVPASTAPAQRSATFIFGAVEDPAAVVPAPASTQFSFGDLPAPTPFGSQGPIPVIGNHAFSFDITQLTSIVTPHFPELDEFEVEDADENGDEG